MNSKIKRNIRQLLSLMSLILLIGICDVKAGATFNCETVQSGNWTDPAIWTACDGAYPNSPEDAVLIKNGHSIVFDSAIFLELYSFNMESFSELNVFNDQSSFRVVVHGADFNSQMGRIISETRIIINTFQGDVLLSDLNLTGENTLNINSAQNISFFGTPLAVNAYFINAKSNDINGEIHIYGDMQVANSQTYDSKVIIHNDLKFVGDSEFNNLLLLNSYNVEIEALNSDSSIENGLEGEINSTLTKTGDSGLILNSSILNGEIQIMEGELLIWGLVQTATSIFGEALISGFGEIDDSLTLSNNAVISPGSYSTPYNTLTIKDISVVSPDVIWDLNIRGHIPGTDYDQIIVTDSIALNGVLNSQIFGDYFVGDEFKIIDVQSLNSITGQFIGLPEGSLYRGKYQISYQGGDGNDVTLTTVCNSEALVTNNLDSGPGSLRNAIDSVCPSGSEIHFDNSYEINLSSPIVINDGQFLDINFDSGLSQTFTSSGNHPVLMVENGAYIRFQGVTIKDVTSDQGALVNYGVLTFYEAYFANNTNTGNSGGGAITNYGNMTVEQSGFYQNNASQGGAIYSSSAGFIRNSSFYQNGHLITDQGGAIYNNGQFEMWNVTIVDSGNAGMSQGKAIYNVEPKIEMRLINTVIANNSSSGSDCYSVLPVDFYNVFEPHTWIQDGSCDAPLSGDPQLGAWGYNGGYAPAINLLPLSPLINSGTEYFCYFANNVSDQNGTYRSLGISCDIGAVEFQDDVPPQVNAVSIDGQNINICGNTSTLSNELKITYNEPMLDAEISGYYEVLHAGVDQSFLTPDDQVIGVLSAGSDQAHPYPTITLELANPIPEGLVRLLVDGEITDEFYLDLNDGNGHQHPFRVELNNAFVQGHFDVCEGQDPLSLWQINSNTPVTTSVDKDDSNVSSSLHTSINNVNAFSIGQCVNLNGAVDMDMSLFIKSETVNPSSSQSQFFNQGLTHSVAMSCALYDGVDCSGSLSGNLSALDQNVIIDFAWQEIEMNMGSLEASVMSANCEFNITTDDTNLTNIQVDGLKLQGLSDLIFEDSFDNNN